MLKLTQKSRFQKMTVIFVVSFIIAFISRRFSFFSDDENKFIIEIFDANGYKYAFRLRDEIPEYLFMLSITYKEGNAN